MSSRSCIKRAWCAIKGTFTRSGKNRVAPFPLPSDPDPSDPQEDSSGLKSKAKEKPADLQPGLSNMEQIIPAII